MGDLPAGIVTFLMTDVEGSTRRWQDDPAAMSAALDEHDRLVLAEVESAGGLVVKSRGEGDSVFAVFSRASAALVAAAAIQRRLAGVAAGLQVRMAIHTGEPEMRDGDYYGPVVNRCARLRAVAHGGQVLVSGSTAGVVREAMPVDLSLGDLGEHRLRDLDLPERVLQLSGEGLAADFPRLRSLAVVPHNLPLQATSFVGRERELAEVRDLLTRMRLVTVLGPGGQGKTRLAMRLAADLLQDFPGGVFLVELDAIRDPNLIPNAVASALELREQPGRSLVQTVVDHIRDRRLLLVLDNCEHLVAGCAVLIARLLGNAPEVRVLATSQEPLNVPGEVRWSLPALGLLPAERDGAGPEPGVVSEAVQFFVERARLARPGFDLDQRSGPAVAEICRRLDGIPLAIELAAAQIAVLTPTDIEARLDDRFRLLGTGKRLAAPRQQTLLAAVTWSHDLLDERQKILFRRLAVFAHGLDLDAAEAVAAGSSAEASDILGVLSALVDKSVVVAEEGSAGRARYRLLETLREFALARLVEAGEDQETRRRHALHYLALVDDSEHKVWGPDAQSWLERYDADHDNARSAISWALKRDPELAARLATDWSWYRRHRGHITEGRESLAVTLAGYDEVGGHLRVDALRAAASLAWHQGDLDDARRLYEEARAAAGGDASERSAWILTGLGNVAQDGGDLSSARTFYERALIMARECGAIRHQAVDLHNLGEITFQEHNPLAARGFFEEGLSLFLRAGDRKAAAALQSELSRVALEEGHLDVARPMLRAALPVVAQFKDPLFVASVLETFSALATAEGQAERALRLGGAATSLKASVGSSHVWRSDEPYNEGNWARMRQLLDADAAEAAWDSGRQMTLEEAVSYALLDA